MQSILIKDTTREQRIQIVNKALNVCGSECEFCNGCDNLGGGLTDTFYQPYICEEEPRHFMLTEELPCIRNLKNQP